MYGTLVHTNESLTKYTTLLPLDKSMQNAISKVIYRTLVSIVFPNYPV